jgi:lysozyme
MAPLAREALALIEDFEGYHRKLPDGRAAPYLCPARVPTIGVGTTFYEDRRKVTLNDPPISRDRAYELLAFELRECEAGVARYTTRRLHPLSFGALVSFAYNCGVGAYRGSGLRRAVNDGDDQRAAAEFLKWRLAGGVVLAGLERRRRAEAALYLKGIRDAHVGGGGPILDPGSIWNGRTGADDGAKPESSAGRRSDRDELAAGDGGPAAAKPGARSPAVAGQTAVRAPGPGGGAGGGAGPWQQSPFADGA